MDRKGRFHIERLEERIAPKAYADLFVTPPGLDGATLELPVSEEGCDSGIRTHASDASDSVVECDD